MKIDIYTSAKDGSKYLSVEKGTKLESLTLSSDIDKDLLSLSPFKTRLEIDESKAHPALDHKDIVKQIKAQHYAVHGAKISINLTVAD
ncbi:MAG: hypothetical protein ACJAUT_000317 [Cellvibrionaceae bacterium]